MRVVCEWSHKCRIMWSVYFSSLVLKYVVPALCLALDHLFSTQAWTIDCISPTQRKWNGLSVRQVCVCSCTEGRTEQTHNTSFRIGPYSTALHCTINIIYSELVATHSISRSRSKCCFPGWLWLQPFPGLVFPCNAARLLNAALCLWSQPFCASLVKKIILNLYEFLMLSNFRKSMMKVS